MTVEQIAIRQEIRQMLNEAGINKNTLKDMVKDVLDEEINKAIKQAIHEYDVEGKINMRVANKIDNIMIDGIKSAARDRLTNVFNRMSIRVEIKDDKGNSITG